MSDTPPTPLPARRRLLLNASAVRQFVRAHGKRPSQDFLNAVERHLARKLAQACAVHNGGKKTLDLAVADYVGVLPH